MDGLKWLLQASLLMLAWLGVELGGAGAEAQAAERGSSVVFFMVDPGS